MAALIDPMPEIEFRDGFRVVPHHVAAILAGFETWKFTYEEAIKLANSGMLRNALGQIQRKTIDGHFRENR